MRRATDAERAATVGDARAALRRLTGYLRPYRVHLVIVASLVIVYTVLGVLGPYLIAVAIDDYIVPGDAAGLTRIALIMVAVYAGMWVTGAGYGRIMAAVAQEAMYVLREDLFDHMQTLSLSYYDRQSAGDLLSRLTNDMDAITRLISQNLVSFVASITTMIGVVVMMLILNVWLTLTVLAVVPIMFIIVGVLMKRIGPAFRQLHADLGTLNGLLEETLSGQRAVIAYGRHDAVLEDFAARNEAARETGVRANILAGLLPPLTMILTNFNLAVVVGVGAVMAVNGFAGVTVGLIAAFTDYTRRFGQPLMQISNLSNAIVAALAGAERIFAVLDERPAVHDAPDAVPLRDVKGEVVFEGVDFSYEPGVPVLRDVSLTARPGETVALVGPTGAGKTTIVNVLTRFYDIENGDIRIDGHEIRDVRQDSLRRRLGIVLQDTFLFSNTVMENIRYGRLDATDDEVIAAAKLANADTFIHRLPDGYETVLSEHGTNLSQGQHQLLAIARAILADPSILILDEATSSVDTRTELQIQEALLTLMAGRTSFVIAHRLSTIRDADQILVIDDGRIVERGTHRELLDEGGFYHTLYTSQFKGQAVAV